MKSWPGLPRETAPARPSSAAPGRSGAATPAGQHPAAGPGMDLSPDPAPASPSSPPCPSLPRPRSRLATSTPLSGATLAATHRTVARAGWTPEGLRNGEPTSDRTLVQAEAGPPPPTAPTPTWHSEMRYLAQDAPVCSIHNRPAYSGADLTGRACCGHDCFCGPPRDLAPTLAGRRGGVCGGNGGILRGGGRRGQWGEPWHGRFSHALCAGFREPAAVASAR